MDYSQNQVVVHNQQELNAVPANYSGTIFVELKNFGDKFFPINSGYERKGLADGNEMCVKHLDANFIFSGEYGDSSPTIFNTYKKIKVIGNVTIFLQKNCSCEVELRDKSKLFARYPVNLVAYGNSNVICDDFSNSSRAARDSEARNCDNVFSEGLPKIMSYDNTYVHIWKSEMDNTFIETHDNSKVEKLGGNRSVEAYDNSIIDVHDNVVVTCYDHSKVSLYDNADVMAYDNAELMAYGGRATIYDSATFRRLGSAEIIDNRSRYNNNRR